MAILQNSLLPVTATEDVPPAAYTVDSSCKFDGSTSYLTRTFASDGNRTKWTWASWVKRSGLTGPYSGGDYFNVFRVAPDPGAGNYDTAIQFNADGTLMFYVYEAGYSCNLITTQVFRDTSAWYHIALKYDSTPTSPGGNDICFYVNGVQVTALGTSLYPAQNTESGMNYAGVHYIGAEVDSSDHYMDGYLADVYFIDGYAIDPLDDFVEISSTTGQLIPKEFSMANHGGNSFHLPFAEGHDSELLINSNHKEGSTNFEDTSGADHAITSTYATHSISVGNPFTGSDRAIYLAGDFDYLTIPNSTDWDVGAGDWTWELWVNVNADSTGSGAYVSRRSGAANNTSSFHMGYFESGGVHQWEMSLYAGGGNSYYGTYRHDSFEAGRWHHIVMCRTGGKIFCYDDGKLLTEGGGSASADIGTTSSNDPATQITIGGDEYWISQNNYGGITPEGYMDDIRFVNGTAVYKAFTDLSSSNLNHANQFTDSSTTGTTHTVAAYGNTAHTRAVKKIGDSSIRFDKTNQGSTGSGTSVSGLSIPDHDDFDFSSSGANGVFTVEGWFRFDNPGDGATSTGGDSGGLISKNYNTDGHGDTYDWSLQYYSDGSNSHDYGFLYFYSYSGWPGWYVKDVITDADTWYHIAVVGSGTSSNNIELFIDGVSQGTRDSGTYSNGSGPLLIGRADNNNNTNDLEGYADQIRISDSARYTSSFTDFPGGNGGSISSPTAFTDDSDTLLLVQADDYTHAITPNGDVKHTTKTVTDSHRGSVYFDGSDYLSIPHNPEFDLGDTFTLEAWCYATSIQNTQGTIFSKSGSFQFGIDGGGTNDIRYYNNSTTYLDSDDDFPENRWVHVAVTFDSGTLKFYQDGVLIKTSTGVSNPATSTNELLIGGSGTAAEYWTGYLDDIRIVKGTAITPPAGGPTAPLETVTNTIFHLQSKGRSFDRPTEKLTEITNTKLLIQADDDDTAVVDRSTAGTTHTISHYGISLPATASTPYDAAMKRSAVKFDAGSSSQYVTAPNHADFNFGSGLFTIEAWVYSTSTNYFAILENSSGGGANRGFHFYLDAGRTPYMDLNSDGSGTGWQSNAGTTNAVSLNTWHHVAVCRAANGAGYFWVDGAAAGTFTDTTDVYESPDDTYSGRGSYGYVYDVCVTKGEAKYTSSFSKPANPLVTTKITHPGGDDSGNKNHWAVEGLGGHDIVGDAPGAGNNYCVLNCLGGITSGVHGTITDGNLKMAHTPAEIGQAVGTFGVTSGLWYFEGTNNNTEWTYFGVTPDYLYGGGQTSPNSYFLYSDGNIHVRYERYVAGANVGRWGDADTTTNDNDIIGVAFDADNGKIWYSVNGSWSGSGGAFDSSAPDSTISGYSAGAKTWFPVVAAWTSSVNVNFGQDPTFNNHSTTSGVTPATSEFFYTPPSGFKSLCTENLPDPGVNNAVDAEKAFAAVTYDGDGTTNGSKVVSVSFTPDLVWVKNRDSAKLHVVVDSVRGEDSSGDHMPLYPNTDGTETSGYGPVIELDTAGAFTAYANTSQYNASSHNHSGDKHVAWSWKAGESFDAGDGSGTGSKNEDAGFSIVKWDGTDSDYNNDGGDVSGYTRTVNHGLGEAPEMIIAKSRSNNDNAATSSDPAGWVVYHKDLSTGYFITLDDDGTEIDTSSGYAYPPIASVNNTTFTVKNADDGSGNYYYLNFGDEVSGFWSGDTYVAYCFRSIEGYSKVGIRSGTGANSFLHLDFKPRFLLYKNKGSSGNNWHIFDSERPGYNVISGDALYTDLNNAEGGTHTLDFLSNGIMFRSTEDWLNTEGDEYIYYAVGDSFKHSVAR